MAQERRDIEKYVKHFGTKFYQVIVQSRSGKRQRTECLLPSRSRTANTHWYWLDIPNEPPTGEGLEDIPPPVIGRPLCVEVAVETPEGDLVLETWVLSMKNRKDDSERVFAIYNNLSNLLRSVIVTSRTMTAYHVARQYRGELILKYRYYNSKPKLEGLGRSSNDYNARLIGGVTTILGQVTVEAAWRKDDNIKMPSAMESIVMTSDYFNAPEKRHSPDDRQTVPAQCRRNAFPIQTAFQITVPTLAQPPVTIPHLSIDENVNGRSSGIGWFSPLSTAFGTTSTVIVDQPEPFQALLDPQLTPTNTDDDDSKSEEVDQTPGDVVKDSPPGEDETDFVYLDVKTVFDSTEVSSVGQFYRHLRQQPSHLPLFDLWDETIALDELGARIAHFDDRQREFKAFSTTLLT